MATTTATKASKEREILQNKIDHLLRSTTTRHAAAIEQIERETNAVDDMLVPMQDMRVTPGTTAVELQYADGSKVLSRHALNQIAERVGMPAKYARELNATEWGRDLLAHAANTHLDNRKNNRMLIRSVDDKVRGVLSNRYRRMNTPLLYQTFFQGMTGAGAALYEAWYSETKVHFSFVFPEVITIDTENNGTITTVFGARMANSQFGAGALAVRLFQMNVVCLNGMVSQKAVRQLHMGGINDDIASAETLMKYTDATQSLVHDAIQSIAAPERRQGLLDSIAGAAAQRIDMAKELERLPKIGLTKGETGQVQELLLQNDPAQGIQGAPTMWKLSQALTAVGRDMESDRRFELQEYAGKLIDLN